MISLFDTYKKRMQVHGDTPRESWISLGKRNLLELAPHSPAYKCVDIDGVEEHLLIISRDEPNEKTIRMMPGRSFRVGQIVTWKTTHWLITQKDEDDEISMRGKIEQCNRQLKWQNNETGEIITRWCTAEKPYYSNLFSDSTLTLSTREFKIQLPYDSETSKIGLDKRFMLDEIDGEPKTYRVTSVDAITERFDRDGESSGFLVLNVKQDLYNPKTDNKELGICNYFDASDSITEQSTGVNRCSIVYTGKPSIRYGGSAKRLQFLRDGVLLSDSTSLSWSTDLGAESNKFEITTESSEFRIRALDFSELEGLIFTVACDDISTGDRATIALEVTS